MHFIPLQILQQQTLQVIKLQKCSDFSQVLFQLFSEILIRQCQAFIPQLFVHITLQGIITMAMVRFLLMIFPLILPCFILCFAPPFQILLPHNYLILRLLLCLRLLHLILILMSLHF